MNVRITFIFIGVIIINHWIEKKTCLEWIFMPLILWYSDISDQEVLKCGVWPWKRNILQIEQVMKYAPITDKNHIAYGMMFKLALSFVVLYRSVTKYLFLEFDRRLDARTLANSLITGSVADRFLQYTLLQSLFMLHSESLPQTMPPKLTVFLQKPIQRLIKTFFTTHCSQ